MPSSRHEFESSGQQPHRESMKIKAVTMTGADKSVSPDALFALSEKYPYVEWGILFASQDVDAPRFPSYGWIGKLLEEAPKSLRLCAHLCGPWVGEALTGEPLSPLITDFPQFQRVQLNTHGSRRWKAYQEPKWALTLPHDKQIIFQVDGENVKVSEWVARGYGVPLFDTSSGAGVTPDRLGEQWPTPMGGYCGYAGGLGPLNILEQLGQIEQVVGDRTIWIDMETRVRSNKDKLFDLEKVETVLKAVEPYILKD